MPVARSARSSDAPTATTVDGLSPTDELRAKLGIASLDDDLLRLALTHRSFAYEAGGLPTNERLEFLGDSVLGVIITDALYHRHPDLSEGRLARLRSAVVNARALASVARTLDLGDYLRLGRGEESTGGRDKSSILADALEAVIGAVYLDSSFPVTRDLVLELFEPLMDVAVGLGAGLDWKTSLQELCATLQLGVPEYVVHERVEQEVHDVGGDGDAAAEVDRADDRLDGVGQDRGLVATAGGVLATTQLDVGAEADLTADAGQCAGVDDGRAELGQVTLGQVGMGAVESLGDDHPEHRVTEELQPLVGRQTAVLVGEGTVREGALEQLGVQLGIPEGCSELGVVGQRTGPGQRT